MAGLSAASLPTGARGRGLAGLLTLAALAVLWLGVVSPLADIYNASADDIIQRQALAGRMQDLADSLPALRKQANAGQVRDAPAAALLEGASDAVAAANLQSFLETMCAGTGAKLTSTEALPAEPAGLYHRIGLRVSVDANWVQLTQLLRAIQQATPRMFVDDVQLHAQPTADQTRELPLDIALTVVAFRLPGSTLPDGAPGDAPPIDAPPIDAPADPRATQPAPAAP